MLHARFSNQSYQYVVIVGGVSSSTLTILELMYMCQFQPNWAQRILYGHIIPKGFENRYNQLYLDSILLLLMNNDEHSPDSNMAKSADNNDNQIENSNKGKIYLIETLEAVYIL